MRSRAFSNISTLFSWEEVPINPTRQILSFSGPKPPPISMPKSLNSRERTAASDIPSGTRTVFKTHRRSSGWTSISNPMASTPATSAR